jgi:hypothetical protein
MANRINLNVPDNTRQILDRLNMTHGFTITTSMCKGAGLLEYILDAQKRGASFRVYEKDGTYREVVIRFE